MHNPFLIFKFIQPEEYLSPVDLAQERRNQYSIWMIDARKFLGIKYCYIVSLVIARDRDNIDLNIIPYPDARQIVYTTRLNIHYATRITYPPTWAQIWVILDKLIYRAHSGQSGFFINEIKYDHKGTLIGRTAT